MLFLLLFLPFICNFDFIFFFIQNINQNPPPGVYQAEHELMCSGTTTCICILFWILYQCTIMTCYHLCAEHFSFPSFSFLLSFLPLFFSLTHAQQAARTGQTEGNHTASLAPLQPSPHGPSQPCPPSKPRPPASPPPFPSLTSSPWALMELQVRSWPPPMESLTQTHFSLWDDQNACIWPLSCYPHPQFYPKWTLISEFCGIPFFN
jgi:hypothetical protein